MEPFTHSLKLCGLSIVGVLAIGGCSSESGAPRAATAAPRQQVMSSEAQTRTMESALYTGRYDAADGAYHLPAHVRWRVLPRHVGLGPGGTTVDERITVVLEDKPQSFWPLVVKMSTDEAEKLQRELAKAIAEKKSGEGEGAGE